MEIITVFLAILSLFMIIGIGYIAQKINILNHDRVYLISRILVNIAIPGNNHQQHAGTPYASNDEYC